MFASERRTIILQYIADRGRVQASDLATEFAVSRMTIHRDLEQLADEGLVEKVFGGAVSPRTSAEPTSVSCMMCGMRVRQRTTFVLQLGDDTQLRACCPHCGLMLLSSRTEATSALAADFLHGRMVNVRSAVFLLGSDLTLCCTPSVLCFQNREDAGRFQAGFGGEIMSLTMAQAHLKNHMALPEVTGTSEVPVT
ncbi:MAG: DeoR/GlpR transcriptional regulator [Caldilineales bacterium]|nr:DeoR/GlpR transcriptional regulator [Caldilineales bacterium]